jgi:hypothetical protein
MKVELITKSLANVKSESQGKNLQRFKKRSKTRKDVQILVDGNKLPQSFLNTIGDCRCFRARWCAEVVVTLRGISGSTSPRFGDTTGQQYGRHSKGSRIMKP